MPTNTTEPKPGRENPRTTRIRDIVLAAAIELLLTEGSEAVTAVRISEHTGVARSTIYRHWPDQRTLLLETVDQLLTPHHEMEPAGDIAIDLTTALQDLARRLSKRPFHVVFATLLDHANRSSDHLAAQRRLVTSVLEPLNELLRDAVERGELTDLDIDVAVAQLAGPIFTQHIMLRTTISNDLISETTAHFLHQHHWR